MLFSGLSFLYGFLPLTLLLYFLSPSMRWRNAVLLFASLFFYAWGEPRFLPLLIGSALLSWLCGLGMERGRRCCFPLALALLLGSLVFFKYLHFIAGAFASLFGLQLSLPALPLPAGISFYTFQLLAYLFDLRRGKIRAERRFSAFLLYVSFFPQLLQGPIVRYDTVETALRVREHSWEGAASGFRRFTLGLAKKVLLADGIAVIVSRIYDAPALAGTGALWLAGVGFSVQLYLDFSGYSDMAVGLGRLFGFPLPENFNYPYAAVSVTDFWRRWHMTLSYWFRDYVYIPLGGNRVRRGRYALNILIVWSLTGLWHGAAWNFVLWGVYYGLLLLFEKLVLGARIERVPRLLRRCGTLVLVTLGWVLFKLTDTAQLMSALRGMFFYTPTDWRTLLILDSSVVSKLPALVFGILFSFPVAKKVRIPDEGALSALLINGACFLLLVLSILFQNSASFTPFLYHNF